MNLSMIVCRQGSCFRSAAFFHRIVLGLFLLLPGAVCAAALFRSAPSQLNPAEKYVLEQVAAGKLASLQEVFPEATNRVLRAAFLESLLTNTRKDFSIHRNGVLIEAAVLEEPIDLRNAEISHETQLTRCRFQAEVNFSKSFFENSLSIEGSVFQDTANFYAMKVGRGACFDKTVFGGGVNLEQAEITGVFTASKAQFTSPQARANFNSLKVVGNVFFTEAVFAGPVNLQYCHILDNFKMDHCQFSHPTNLVNYEGLKVGGTASFVQSAFAGYVSFKDASFVTVDFSEVKWPAHTNAFPWLWLNGMTYQRIGAGSEQESWSNLLGLLNRCAHGTAYSKEVYGNLEGFYRRLGYPKQADMVFIAQQQRERDEILKGLDWWWNFFLDWFVHYGRSPERALFWSMAIVLFGLGVFRPRYMEPQKTDYKAGRFSPFWYSMDLFLPFIKLHDADIWKPKDDCGFPRVWSRIHTMLGWALIPIAVAAWTGMLSR